MADLVRTVATLLTSLADNTTGNITAQNIRDMLITLQPTYGNCYLTATAPTVISGTGSYTKALGTTTLGATVRGFDMPASNRIRNTQAATVNRLCLVIATASVTPGAAAIHEIGFKLAKNGAVIDDSEVLITTTSTTTQDFTATVVALVDLAYQDYVELFITNTTNTGSPTVTKLNLTAVGFAV